MGEAQHLFTGTLSVEPKPKRQKEADVMKEKSKGLKESKKAPQMTLKEKRKLKKEKKNR